ncbi:GQ67_04290T0 [Komagataella phaffii]|nr:GQ67_04290T0 [Komagataella phaffii]AOA69003.1 GQ68_04261T0 [Komagataella phaffii GS115]
MPYRASGSISNFELIEESDKRDYTTTVAAAPFQLVLSFWVTMPSKLESCIIKATDEKLTSDNWGYIIEVCDTINDEPETGPATAIIYINKRLSIKDANVLLRSLSLIIAMAENCGSRMKQAIATKGFISTFVKLIEDSRIHHTIKLKIANMLHQLSESFIDDPSLAIIDKTCSRLRSQYPDLFAPAPSKPSKREISQDDRQREQEMLDRALKLSLEEYNRTESPPLKKNETLKSNPEFVTVDNSYKWSSADSHQKLDEKVDSHPKFKSSSVTSVEDNEPLSEIVNTGSIAKVAKVRALYDLVSNEAGELSFHRGDIITVLASVYKDWWKGSLKGKVGIFPLNYVTPIKELTVHEAMEEAAKEYRIWKQSRQIDLFLNKLTEVHALVTNTGNYDALNDLLEDETISKLYNSLTPLRPQLTRLIEKYSNRKEEMLSLNDKLIKSERLYSNLLEASVSRFKSAHDSAYSNDDPRQAYS